MKREDFKKIIKLRSAWKIDKRKGNYQLPNGESLKSYVRELVESQMQLDNLLISESGSLRFGTGGDWNMDTNEFNDYTILVFAQKNETCSFDEMERRIDRIVNEIIY